MMNDKELHALFSSYQNFSFQVYAFSFLKVMVMYDIMLPECFVNFRHVYF